MENLKKSIFDNRETITHKNNKIDTYLQIEKETLYDKEINFINNIVNNLAFTLPRESFSCKYGILLYSFDHKDKDREVYISPEVYLIEGDCIVYEVIDHKKYFTVTNNEILISRQNKYFCEIPLKQFLKYVSAEDIFNFLDKYINSNYEELINIEKRVRFLETHGMI